MIRSKRNWRASARAKEAPGIDSVKLINYDFKKYGSAQERIRILARWTSDIGSK